VPSDNDTEHHHAWQHLRDLSDTLRDKRIDDLLATHDQLGRTLRLSHCGLYLDLSKNRVNPAALQALATLFQSYQASDRLKTLYCGAIVNNTEHRPALHTALRAAICNQNVPDARLIRDDYKPVATLANSAYQGLLLGHSGKPLRDVVNLGIGGSDLGPRMAATALSACHDGATKVHFVSSLDSTELSETLATLSADSTLFLVSSKSFSTEETLFNARQAIDWFRQQTGQKNLRGHFAAITGNTEAAAALGIPRDCIFGVPEGVGGRYSLWSAIGLPLMIAIGVPRFEQMLAGAHAMDQHALHSDFTENMPALLAGMEIWNSNMLGYSSLAIIPYSYPLRLLPAYLQQLVMESNGKNRTREGMPVRQTTAPLVWGTAGTEGQHSYHQWLHQGTQVAPVDFILPLGTADAESNTRLASHCIAQSKVLMEGKTIGAVIEELVAKGMPEDEARAIAPHKAMPGNRPSNTLIMDSMSPANLGALLALYEHKTFFTSVLWDINAFDQWGVELGKQLSRTVRSQLSDLVTPSLDASSNALITHLQTRLN
jgi:glucose-6-phosphate isomerase